MSLERALGYNSTPPRQRAVDSPPMVRADWRRGPRLYTHVDAFAPPRSNRKREGVDTTRARQPMGVVRAGGGGRARVEAVNLCTR